MKRFGCLLLLALLLTGCKQTDLGIIGGEDGPTAIFVSGDSDGAEYYDAIPSLDGVPTPPGDFDTGWEYAEMGTITIRMKNVTEQDYMTYVEETLPDRGYPAMESAVQSDEDTHQYAQHAGDKYLLQLVYDTTTGELMVTAIEQ